MAFITKEEATVTEKVAFTRKQEEKQFSAQIVVSYRTKHPGLAGLLILHHTTINQAINSTTKKGCNFAIFHPIAFYTNSLEAQLDLLILILWHVQECANGAIQNSHSS